MSYNTILAIIFLGFLLLISIKILFKPLKAFFKLIISCAASTLGLFAFNIFGNIIGLHIGLNLITILIVGLFGVPGIALLLFLQIIFRA